MMSNIASCCCLACVPTKHVGIVEMCGKYIKTIASGLHWIWCCQLVRPVSTKLHQYKNTTKTKTKDDVNVTLETVIQYYIAEEDADVAYYSLDHPTKQLDSYVDNCIRSHVPKMTTEELYNSTDEISNAVKNSVALQMKEHGYTITDTLLTEIILPPTVVEAMNSKKQQMQLKIAAEYKAEADKMTAIKHAEAQAETMRLQGEGVAQQRLAIVKGLEDSIKKISQTAGINPEEAMTYTLSAQYLDTLRDIGTKSQSTILVPYSNNPNDLLRNSSIEADLIKQAQRTDLIKQVLRKKSEHAEKKEAH